MFASAVVETIAAATGLTALGWSILSAVQAKRTAAARKAERREVDNIKVTQDALTGTITLQHEDNERLRLRLRVLEDDFARCMRRTDQLIRVLDEHGIRIPDGY